MVDDIGWILWAATIGLDSPVAARVEAARAAGCRRVSIAAPDVARLSADGTTPEDLGRLLRDAGLDVVMDPVMNWYGGSPIPGPFGESPFEDQLRIAEALQPVAMSAIGPFAPDEVPAAELPARFADFCDRAADLGAQVEYEFMPFTAIPNLATAWDVVRAADRPNGGMLFDTWHFFRGTPDFELLEQVPGERIVAVQVSDAAAELHGSLGEDTFHRLLPGDGVFDLERVLGVLDRIGGLRWIGAEVLSPDTEAMPPADAARLANGRVRDLLAALP